MGQIISGFIQTRLSRNTALALAFIFIGAGLFLFVQPAHAVQEIMDAFIWAFGRLVQIIVGVLGTLLINLFYVLIAVANYNQFLASSAVTAGWVVVRDIVNMFFVLVLLAIAIGTILQRQQYHYAQALPKFLVAAVLVNFSKTIAGIFIDFAQVVMMTFVGAISGAAGGNLAALLGIPGLLKQVNPLRGGASNTSPELVAFGGFFLAMMFVAIAIIVVGILVVMLVIRIVALWFLIILSPAAFFLMALPNDKGYSAKWWDQFINYLLVGPVTMFFLWLSLSVVASQSGNTNDATKISTATELGFDFRGFGSEYPTIGEGLLGQTGISTIGGIASYILGICMLMATLMAAQQLSSVGGNLAGAGAGYVKGWFAGKRGPLNPFRAARDRLEAYGKIRRDERKQRVERDAARFAQGVAIAKQFPGKAARNVGRRIYAAEGPIGEAARGAHVLAGRASGVIDRTMQGLSSGIFGWGKEHKERLANRKEESARVAAENRAAAGIHLNDANFYDTQAREAEQINDHETANESRRLATQSRAEAYRLTNNAEGLEMRGVFDSAQAILPTLARETTKLFGAALLGPLGAAAFYGPGIITGLQRSGESQSLAAANALGSAMSKFIRDLNSLDSQTLHGIANRTIPGHSNAEMAAAMRILSRRTPANGGYETGQRNVRFGQYAGLINADATEILGWNRDWVNRGAEARAATADDIMELRDVIRGTRNPQ